MKEIGGYFGLEELIKNEFYPKLISLNTGRHALLYLLITRKIKKLYIPYYLCDSVCNMMHKYKFEFEYYHIDAAFNPIFNKTLKDDEYLYIVNYYGQLDNDKVLLLKQKYGRIIIDNTHAFFQEPIDGIDTIYSCRKFFGVPDGAYLSSDGVLDTELEFDISKDRMKHILGRFEGTASDFYSDFRENDKSFNDTSLMKMSKLTKNLLGAIDYDRVKAVRNQNYEFLKDKLEEFNKLKLVTPIGPYAYPFYVDNGVEIRKKLAKEKIYIATLWPNVLKENKESSIEYDYTANILPLPCDQRYDIEDMRYIINCIH